MCMELGKRDNRSQRVAWFLNWAAEHSPHEYQPYNVILQAINNLGRLPRMDKDEVLAVRGNMHSVRRILQRDYNRDLDVAGGAARATVDDDDKAAVVLPKKMKRLQSAKNAVLTTHSLIDPKRVKDPVTKAYLTHSVASIIKMVGSESFDRKLLPPTDDE